MKVVFNSFSNHAVSFFKENIPLSLTAQNKKIMIIAAAIISCLGLLVYAITRYVFKKPSGQPMTQTTQVQQLPSKIPFLWDENTSPKDLPSGVKPPQGYEWVKGDENAKQFMATEKDLSIVAAVAKSSHAFGSPMMPMDHFLFIGSLVQYACLDYIEAVVQAVADDRYHLRAVFHRLFWEMEHDLTNTDSWKAKGQKALDSLTSVQLMNILAIADDSYQFQEHEIMRIPAEKFLKWQKEFNLPQEFIEGCSKVIDYEKFVKIEAKKGPQICFD